MTGSAATVTKPRILLVEDEPLLREAMMAYLNIDGFHCQSVGSLAGLNAFQASGQTVDVIVFDLGLPDGDGLDAVATFVNANPDVLVAIASARGTTNQRIEGLRRGADVYLTKPVDLAELSLVLKKLAERAQKKQAIGWQLDNKSWVLKAPTGSVVKLTMRELVALELTMAKRGTPVSRDVLAKAWGFKPQNYDFRRMDSALRRLRIKCQDELGFALPLSSVYGYGFVFNDLPAAAD